MITPLFHDPSRKPGKMLEGRVAMYTKMPLLAAKLDHFPPDSVVVVEGPLIPECFYSGQNFLKRGRALFLSLEHHLESIIEKAERKEMVGPSRTLRQAVSKMKPGSYTGYAWDTLNRQEVHHVLLAHCIEGSRLWNLCMEEDPAALRVKGYRSKEESPFHGWTFDVEVPSFSGKDRYVFQMVSVAVDNTPEQYAIWRKMKSRGHVGGRKQGKRHEGCEFKYYIDLTHRRAKPVTTCLHEVIAHRAISAWAKERTGRVILQPFALPSQEIVDVYKNICLKMLVEEKRMNARGLHRLVRRPLSVPEIEIVLWNYMVAHPLRNLFYATKQLRTYNWN